MLVVARGGGGSGQRPTPAARPTPPLGPLGAGAGVGRAQESPAGNASGSCHRSATPPQLALASDITRWQSPDWPGPTQSQTDRPSRWYAPVLVASHIQESLSTPVGIQD